MIKNKINLFIHFLVIIVGISLNAQELFVKDYGANNSIGENFSQPNEEFFGFHSPLLVESDGSFIISSKEKGNNKFLSKILKINKFGDIVWSYTIDKLGNENKLVIKKILQNDSNQYVVLGNNNSKGFIFKLNLNGSYVNNSEKSFETDNGIAIEFQDIILKRKWIKNMLVESYLVTGGSGTANMGFILELSSSFSRYNSVAIAGNNLYVTKIVEDGSDGYIALFTERGGIGDTLISLNSDLTVKLDANQSNIETSFKSTNVMASYNLNSLIKTKDNNFLVAGDLTIQHGNPVALLLKVDSNLNVLWSNTHVEPGYYNLSNPIEQRSFDIFETEKGEIVMTGFNKKNGRAFTFLTKFDAEGNSILGKRYGQSNDFQYGYSIKECIDNGFAIVGNFNGGNLSIIKTDYNGDTALCGNVSDFPRSDISNRIGNYFHDSNYYHKTTPVLLKRTNTKSRLSNYVYEPNGCSFTKPCGTFNCDISGRTILCNELNYIYNGSIAIEDNGYNYISNHQWDVFEVDSNGAILNGGFVYRGHLIDGEPGEFVLPTVQEGKTYIIRLTATNNCGFTDSSDFVVYVKPRHKLEIQSGSGFTICNGQPVTVNFTSNSFPVYVYKNNDVDPIATIYASPYTINTQNGIDNTTDTFTFKTGVDSCGSIGNAKVTVKYVVTDASFNVNLNAGTNSSTINCTSVNRNSSYTNRWRIYQCRQADGSDATTEFRPRQNVLDPIYQNLPLTFADGRTAYYKISHDVSDGVIEDWDACISYKSRIVYITRSGLVVSGNNELNSNINASELIEDVIKPKEGDFKIFPNPTGGMITITQTNENYFNLKSIQVFDMYNVLIMTKSLSKEINQEIDLSNLKAGIYLVKIITVEGDEVIQKLFKN